MNASDESTTGPADTSVGTEGVGEYASAGADDAPTPEIEAAAARGAADVDVETVRRHEDEMNEIGANVEGEGSIE